MPFTIMNLMKFAEKCPKCGGFLQTKSVRKSIGLGFVEIPTAQFCLNPVCDWYQDFADVKKPEEIREGVHGLELTKNQLTALAAGIGIIIIVSLIILFNPASDPEIGPGQNDLNRETVIQNNTLTDSSNPAETAEVIETPDSTYVIEPKSYMIKVDVSHGFYPDTISINKSDTITWSNEENQRPRIVLVSKENLFENHVMQYPDKYQYRFDEVGEFEFVVADYEPYREYPSIGRVIVN